MASITSRVLYHCMLAKYGWQNRNYYKSSLKDCFTSSINQTRSPSVSQFLVQNFFFLIFPPRRSLFSLLASPLYLQPLPPSSPSLSLPLGCPPVVSSERWKDAWFGSECLVKQMIITRSIKLLKYTSTNKENHNAEQTTKIIWFMNYEWIFVIMITKSKISMKNWFTILVNTA